MRSLCHETFISILDNFKGSSLDILRLFVEVEITSKMDITSENKENFQGFFFSPLKPKLKDS